MGSRKENDGSYLDIFGERNKSLVIKQFCKITAKSRKWVFHKLNSYKKCYGSFPDRIDIIVNTGGGSIFEAYYIMKALNKVCNNITCYVCEHCLSAGTLMALGSQRIKFYKDVKGLGLLDAQRILKNGEIVSILEHYQQRRSLHKKFRIKDSKLRYFEKKRNRTYQLDFM